MSSRVVLAPVDVLEVAAGGDHLVDDAPLARGHARVRERHLDFLKPGQPLRDVRRNLGWIERHGGEQGDGEQFHGARF